MSKEQTALERIKDEVAKENGYGDYKSVPTPFKPSVMGVVCERYARECCQATLGDYKEKLKAAFEESIYTRDEILKLINSIK